MCDTQICLEIDHSSIWNSHIFDVEASNLQRTHSKNWLSSKVWDVLCPVVKLWNEKYSLKMYLEGIFNVNNKKEKSVIQKRYAKLE